jgi:CspA family cold shock protein
MISKGPGSVGPVTGTASGAVGVAGSGSGTLSPISGSAVGVRVETAEVAATPASRAPRKLSEEEDMFDYGTVRWFDPARGFGFLDRDGDGGEVYVHAKALPRGTVLVEGDRVRFVLQRQPDGRFRAASAMVIEAA